MKKFFIDHKSTTIKAIKQINKLGGKSLIVTDKKKILRGILSSYDLRKAIMNKNILNKNINKIFNKKVKYVFVDQIKNNMPSIHLTIKKLEICQL
jgi:CBS-domain-containing membrane protein